MAERKRKRRGKIITLIIIIAIIAIVILFIVPRQIKYNIENSYELEKIQKRDIYDYSSFSGVIESINRQNIISKDIVQITDIYVKEGDKVEKDDPLFKNNKNIETKSNISGEVSKIYIDENASVIGGAKVMDIVDYDNLRVTIKVDEYDISSIQEGQEVEVEIDSIKKTIKGVISDISREAQNVNGVSFFSASIELEQDSEIRVGMNAESIILNNKVLGANCISMEALQFTKENEPYVLIEDENGKPIKTNIEVGMNDGMFVEIKSGITEADTIMVPKNTTSAVGGFRPPFSRGEEE